MPCHLSNLRDRSGDFVKTPFPLAVALRLPSLSISSLRSMVRRIGYPSLFLLPVLLLLPNLDGFPYPAYPAYQGAYSDLAITHYPNAFYLKQALSTWHRLPLWSPTILSGYPFFANPLSGVWYPPGWLALILPLPLGINLLVVIHLILGGVGFYRLLRSEGLSLPSALLGGLAFEGMPKIFAHYGAGHVTLLYALGWTPWLLLAAIPVGESSLGNVSRARRASGWGLAAVVMALVFLADVRWAPFAAMLWWAYALRRSSAKFSAETEAKPNGLWRRLLGLAGLTVLAALLAAPLALPLAEYTRLSTRANLVAQDVSAYSLPPARLLGLIFPDLGGFHEWMLYPGSVVLCLALLALIWRQTRPRGQFWLWLALISLIFALGDSLPFFDIATRAPGLNLLRVPARSLFMFGMGLAALAAFGLESLKAGLSEVDTRRAHLFLVSLTGFALLMPALSLALTGNISPGFVWGALATFVVAFWLLFGMHKNRVSHHLWLVGLFALCLFELLGVDQSLFRTRASQEVFANAGDLMGYLAGEPGMFRVYSPSYSLPQENAVRYRLELADGVDPLQLQTYASFMERASGIPFEGYSVTLPPFPQGNPATANAGYLPDADLLGLLNVRFIAAEYDLKVPDLVLRARFGETRLYENRLALPRAWIQPPGSALGENITSVEALVWLPNKILIRASGPGLLVLSETSYPGWTVWVDGRRQKLLSPGGILRGVELSPGEHRVLFLFRPTSLYLGVSLFLLGVVIVVTRTILRYSRGKV